MKIQNDSYNAVGYKRKINLAEPDKKIYKYRDMPGIRNGISCPDTKKVSEVSQAIFSIPSNEQWFDVPVDSLFSNETFFFNAVKALNTCIKSSKVVENKQKAMRMLTQILQTVDIRMPSNLAHNIRIKIQNIVAA